MLSMVFIKNNIPNAIGITQFKTENVCSYTIITSLYCSFTTDTVKYYLFTISSRASYTLTMYYLWTQMLLYHSDT